MILAYDRMGVRKVPNVILCTSQGNISKDYRIQIARNQMLITDLPCSDRVSFLFNGSSLNKNRRYHHFRRSKILVLPRMRSNLGTVTRLFLRRRILPKMTHIHKPQHANWRNWRRLSGGFSARNCICLGLPVSFSVWFLTILFIKIPVVMRHYSHLRKNIWPRMWAECCTSNWSKA